MYKHVVVKNKVRYAMVNGEVYCNEECFKLLKKHNDDLDYTVWCALCGANGREINMCPCKDDKMKPCTLEYHVLKI